jgi:hypothetical protein
MAAMMQLLASRDRTYKLLICEPVGVDRLAPITEDAVGAMTDAACPQPTWPEIRSKDRDRSILVDLGPETLFNGEDNRFLSSGMLSSGAPQALLSGALRALALLLSGALPLWSPVGYDRIRLI